MGARSDGTGHLPAVSRAGAQGAHRVLSLQGAGLPRRQHFGYGHIPKLFAREVNAFARDVLTPFLNFHRPCLFPTEVTDKKGRIRKRYRYQDTMTPFEKLKSLPDAEQYLRPGITIAALEHQASAMSDLDAAVALKLARATLFQLIDRESDPHRRRSA